MTINLHQTMAVVLKSRVPSLAHLTRRVPHHTTTTSRMSNSKTWPMIHTSTQFLWELPLKPFQGNHMFQIFSLMGSKTQYKLMEEIDTFKTSYSKICINRTLLRLSFNPTSSGLASKNRTSSEESSSWEATGQSYRLSGEQIDMEAKVGHLLGSLKEEQSTHSITISVLIFSNRISEW